MRSRFATVFILSLSVMAAGASAYAEEGKLTRFGAEAGPNATGEIPAFEGAQGLKCPEGYQKGDYLPNPYRDEKELLAINHANVDQYKNRLSPGQVARLVRNPNHYMKVYKTHRNFEHPEIYLRATEETSKTARLDEKNVLRGFQGGLPFRFPKNGLEAIWNVKRPWAGDDLVTDDCRRVVSPTGKIRKARWATKIIAMNETRLTERLPNPEGVSGKVLTYYSYPPDREGEGALTVGYDDDTKEVDAWIYYPTLNRVRRAPTLRGGTQLDGESTLDELGQDFSDDVNDWDWKLVGKKEMYIPANNYEIWELDAPDEKECLAGDINPARIRYELRRVWVVEATIKEGKKHPYSKRVGYYDEDFWGPVLADRYDKRGNLWRMAEYYQCYNYCTQRRYVIGYLYLNLESGRYEVFGGCRDKDTKTNKTDVGLGLDEFTVQALRREGR